MEKDKKLETLRRWLESGASDFDYEKSKLLLEQIDNMSDTQLDTIFKMYQESIIQRQNIQEQNLHQKKNNNFLSFLKTLPGGAKVGIFIIICLLIFFSYQGYNERKIKNNLKAVLVQLVCEEDFLNEIIEISQDPFSINSFGRIMVIKNKSERIAKENGFESLDDMNKKSEKFRENDDFINDLEISIQNKCAFDLQNFDMQMMLGDR